MLRRVLVSGASVRRVMLFPQASASPSPPVDNIWAMMNVWRIREKIIRTVLCCAVYDSCAQWYAHIYEQFLKMIVGLCLAFCVFFSGLA